MHPTCSCFLKWGKFAVTTGAIPSPTLGLHMPCRLFNHNSTKHARLVLLIPFRKCSILTPQRLDPLSPSAIQLMSLRNGLLLLTVALAAIHHATADAGKSLSVGSGIVVLSEFPPVQWVHSFWSMPARNRNHHEAILMAMVMYLQEQGSCCNLISHSQKLRCGPHLHYSDACRLP